MGPTALALASLAVLSLALPATGKYLAIALGIVALAAGAIGYRRRGARGGARLLGAAGVTVGAAAVLLGSAKVALTLVAIERLGTLFH